MPLVVAPMGGGPSTPGLVGAVAQAGALGSLANGYLAPGDGRDAIRAVRALTGEPFAVNLFVPTTVAPEPAHIERTAGLLGRYYRELGMGEVPVIERHSEDFDEQLAVVVEERVPVVSFTFGIPRPDQMGLLRDTGAFIIGTATSAEEAAALEAAGADAVCAQGAEAGGHRGSFTPEADAARIGLATLLPQVRDAVRVPVIAAGGIMDGRGICAALALGADAAQLGTAFLRCPEAGTNNAHRHALRAASDVSTTLTRAFSGKSARAIRNRYVEEMSAYDVAPYPVTNALTGPLRKQAARVGSADHLSLWAGQGVALGRELPAGDLVRTLERETVESLERLCRLCR